MSEQTQPIIFVTDTAREKALYIRARDEQPERLALKLEVTGQSPDKYDVGMSLELLAEAAPDDIVQWHDDLPVIVPAASVDRLRGATLDRQGDLETGGLVLENPNRPAPPASPVGGDVPEGDLTGDVAQRVMQVLQQHINPQIASHGGQAQLVAVEEGTAYLRLGGGCQGCGMAKVTLTQGIEQSIKGAVPEIEKVVDVTDHASGTNPYYAPAKK
jgi:Fe/S biogenesis protein NfuA